MFMRTGKTSFITTLFRDLFSQRSAILTMSYITRKLPNQIISKSFNHKRDLSNQDLHCPFCKVSGNKVIAEFKSVVAIEDKHPVTPGHLLVIPSRHINDFFSMTLQERSDAIELVDQMKCLLQSQDQNVLGFNIGVNCGEIAGQTIPHAHIHVIPRRAGDINDPRGGVRGVIPEKMKY